MKLDEIDDVFFLQQVKPVSPRREVVHNVSCIPFYPLPRLITDPTLPIYYLYNMYIIVNLPSEFCHIEQTFAQFGIRIMIIPIWNPFLSNIPRTWMIPVTFPIYIYIYTIWTWVGNVSCLPCFNLSRKCQLPPFVLVTCCVVLVMGHMSRCQSFMSVLLSYRCALYVDNNECTVWRLRLHVQ